MAKKKKKHSKPLPPRDVGTPEVQMKRALLVGPGDPTFATSVLGVLFARNFINSYQLKAGQQYSNLRRKIFGSPFAKTSSLLPGSQGIGEIDEDTEIRIRGRYELAASCLFDCGSTIRITVDKICIYEVMPFSLLHSPSQNKNLLKDIKIGLNAICKALGI